MTRLQLIPNDIRSVMDEMLDCTNDFVLSSLYKHIYTPQYVQAVNQVWGLVWFHMQEIVYE